MSKERLSKLQKWILNRAIENFKDDLKRWGKSNLNFKRPFIYRTDIYFYYYKCVKPRDVPLKYRVSTSRSLNSLEEKGLIEFAPHCRKGMAFFTEEYFSALLKETEKDKEGS